ncbi:MAG: cyclic nucleotide-binding domain-containing protein, partial [Planctomycetota bacterium]|nr:cyclic nucleotide-binding domain-containing protein [Planctomycetota bacterium]
AACLAGHEGLSAAVRGLVRGGASDGEVAERLEGDIARIMAEAGGRAGDVNGEAMYGADGRVPELARAYVSAWLMKAEMEHFAPSPSRDATTFVRRVMEFETFDPEGRACLPARGGAGPQLIIHQTQPCRFDVYAGERFLAAVDMRRDVMPDRIEPAARPWMDRPEFGVTMLGVGTGFSTDRRTTCLIVWSEGKAIAVDLMAGFTAYFHEAGFSSRDVSHICLSHVHSDHDGGILEKILQGEKVTLLSSRPIFESWLRKAEALTCLRRTNIREFVRFVELRPGRATMIPGFVRTWVEFDYSFHSIPAGRFVFRYLGRDGRVRSAAWSGDTLFDPALYDRLHSEGRMTAARRDSLKGFLWDADVVIHDAGGEPLHTSPSNLALLPPDVQRRIVMTHVDRPGAPAGLMRYAREGETIAILPPRSVGRSANGRLLSEEDIAILRASGVFDRLSPEEFDDLVESGRVETHPKSSFLIREGEEGNTFYVLLSGLVRITKEGRTLAEYEPGAFFGELALINEDRRRRASVVAVTDVRVFCLDRAVYHRYDISSVARESLYELANFFASQNSPAMLTLLSRGAFEEYHRGEDIVRAGESSTDIYILLSGVVDVLDGSGARLARIGRVEVLGEIAALRNVPRTATIRVVSDKATAIRLDRDRFRAIGDQFPSFYATVLAKMQKRLDAMRDRGKK